MGGLGLNTSQNHHQYVRDVKAGKFQELYDAIDGVSMLNFYVDMLTTITHMVPDDNTVDVVTALTAWYNSYKDELIMEEDEDNDQAEFPEYDDMD